MKVINKAILPKGFKAAGVSCGIKKSNKLDLALFYSDVPASVAAKFTTNKIQAAHIKVDKQYLKNKTAIQGVLVNSGNANCCTGSKGIKDAKEISKFTGVALHLKNSRVLVASTGIIGKRLPVAKIKTAITGLTKKISARGIDKAGLAILTTDTVAKGITARFNIKDKPVTICGLAKGAGMIAPDMATMLCFIFTDANITQGVLKRALGICVDESFNCITVDGCMSTNDSVILLANGLANNEVIDSNKNLKSFLRALNIICLELAKMIVRDAEGGSKFIQIEVRRAKSFSEARKVALAIANSNLFKTAVYGENTNYGRIFAAIGSSGIDVREQDIKIRVSPLNKKNIFLSIDIDRGNSSAMVYTCDLTPRYIKINAEYN